VTDMRHNFAPETARLEKRGPSPPRWRPSNFGWIRIEASIGHTHFDFCFCPRLCEKGSVSALKAAHAQVLSMVVASERLILVSTERKRPMSPAFLINREILTPRTR
jgi:hypothetical protein